MAVSRLLSDLVRRAKVHMSVSANFRQARQAAQAGMPKKEEQKSEDKDESAENKLAKQNSEGLDDQQQKSADGQQGANPEDDRDKRSVFVKNVHFSADKKEIEQFFLDSDCKVNNITILLDNLTRQPKG